MTQPDFRQDKVYRRGLVLGLTIAEVMILLMFILLMALAAALARKDDQIRALDKGGAGRLLQELQRAYPDTPQTDYFKELRLALQARELLEQTTPESLRDTLLQDAEIGREAREEAARIGASNPAEWALERIGRGRGRHEGLPFFSLSEVDGFYFDSGKATLRPEFERSLRSHIIPRLIAMVRQYDIRIVEVIGHTDEVPMSGASNLDQLLISASGGTTEIAALQSTDNAGLAIARAVSVVRVLRSDPRLRGVTILPLSGAQMIMPVDRLADGSARGDDQSRRRIDIRLRERTGRQERASTSAARR